jgi:hypothetical protein
LRIVRIGYNRIGLNEPSYGLIIPPGTHFHQVNVTVITLS